MPIFAGQFAGSDVVEEGDDIAKVENQSVLLHFDAEPSGPPIVASSFQTF